MSRQFSRTWSSSTVIEEEELLEYIFPAAEVEEDKIKVKNYCIDVGGDTIDTEGFVEFLREKFLYFVFPEDEIEEFGELAYNEAQQRVGPKDDYVRSGLYSELLLFVFVDAVLEMPMICHKLILNQNPSEEQKGSDGVFFGEYNDKESLGIGEAKFYTDRSGGISSSIDSTSKFHGERGDQKRQHELSIASRNLENTNLSEEEIKELADRLTNSSRDYRLIHPIFIGYEEDELHEVQTEAVDGDELREKIVDVVEDGDNLLSYIKETIKEDHENLEKHHLVFIFLPVEDSDEFKARVREAIYPHITT